MMIDVFNHTSFPKPYLDRLGDLIPGHMVLTAFPRLKTLWDLDARRALLDEFDGLPAGAGAVPIRRSSSSASCGKTPVLARMANDGLAEIVEGTSRPLPQLHRLDADEQCRSRGTQRGRSRRCRTAVPEACRSSPTSLGKPLSAPPSSSRFRGAWPRMICRYGCTHARAELARLPERAGFGRRDWFSFGWPYETTACMTRLIYSGFLTSSRPEDHHAPHGRDDSVFAGRSVSAFARSSLERRSATLRRSLKQPPVDYCSNSTPTRRSMARSGRRVAGMRTSERPRACSQRTRHSIRGRAQPTRDTIRAVEALPIPAAERERIFAGNARDLLKLLSVWHWRGRRHEDLQHPDRAARRSRWAPISRCRRRRRLAQSSPSWRSGA